MSIAPCSFADRQELVRFLAFDEYRPIEKQNSHPIDEEGARPVFIVTSTVARIGAVPTA